MILMISTIGRVSECAAALQDSIGEPVLVVSSLVEGMKTLRAESCQIVVFDQNLIEYEPNELDMAFAHLETATPLVVNFALTSPRRLLCEVRAAQKRRRLEEQAARSAASRRLQARLNSAMTTLLFHCHQASNHPGTPEKTIDELSEIEQCILRIATEVEALNPNPSFTN